MFWGQSVAAFSNTGSASGYRIKKNTGNKLLPTPYFSNPEDGTDRLSRKFGKIYRYWLSNSPEERSFSATSYTEPRLNVNASTP